MIFDLRLQYFGYNCVQWLLTWSYYIQADGIFSVVYLNWLAVLSTEWRKTFTAVPPRAWLPASRSALCFPWEFTAEELRRGRMGWPCRFRQVLRNLTSGSASLKPALIFKRSSRAPGIWGISAWKLCVHSECLHCVVSQRTPRRVPGFENGVWKGRKVPL